MYFFMCQKFSSYLLVFILSLHFLFNKAESSFAKLYKLMFLDFWITFESGSILLPSSKVTFLNGEKWV